MIQRRRQVETHVGQNEQFARAMYYSHSFWGWLKTAFKQWININCKWQICIHHYQVQIDKMYYHEVHHPLYASETPLTTEPFRTRMILVHLNGAFFFLSYCLIDENALFEISSISLTTFLKYHSMCFLIRTLIWIFFEDQIILRTLKILVK